MAPGVREWTGVRLAALWPGSPESPVPGGAYCPDQQTRQQTTQEEPALDVLHLTEHDFRRLAKDPADGGQQRGPEYRAERVERRKRADESAVVPISTGPAIRSPYANRMPMTLRLG